jgi:hypothetical protein
MLFLVNCDLLFFSQDTGARPFAIRDRWKDIEIPVAPPPVTPRVPLDADICNNKRNPK